MSATKNRPAPSKNELIPIIINDKEEHLVDAYILHKNLKIETPFHKWIDRRIQEYGFQQNKDYQTNLSVRSDGKAGKMRLDYHLTLDTAKEIAMVERSEIGRKIRRYFIEAEKELQHKRLYGQVATLTDIKKQVPTLNWNGRTIYNYREAQRVLGFSIKSSLNNVKRKYDAQIGVINRVAYVSEEYIKLMISRATARKLAIDTQTALPLLPDGFGQVKMF